MPIFDQTVQAVKTRMNLTSEPIQTYPKLSSISFLLAKFLQTPGSFGYQKRGNTRAAATISA